jgi:hypothetical protein
MDDELLSLIVTERRKLSSQVVPVITLTGMSVNYSMCFLWFRHGYCFSEKEACAPNNVPACRRCHSQGFYVGNSNRSVGATCGSIRIVTLAGMLQVATSPPLFPPRMVTRCLFS